MKCPCEECICLAVCKHKNYEVLFSECKLLVNYEPSYKSLYTRDEDKMAIIYDTLNPIKWGYKYSVGHLHRKHGKKVKILYGARWI